MMKKEGELKVKTCKCDNCNTEIQINIQESVIDNNVEDKIMEQFFCCPKCGSRYTICIYDNYMRKRIAARKFFNKSKYVRKTDEKLVREMQEHLKELKVKYNRE